MTETAILDRPLGRSLFATLAPQAPDALLGLIRLFQADHRMGKIDLGVGVFRDEAGATPVMGAVKQAEARLLAEQSSKTYLGPEGDSEFVERLAQFVMGDDAARSGRLTGVQTPGGTGALRLGAALIARARPGVTIWTGSPTWPNHAPIFHEAGLAVWPHRFFDRETSAVDFAGMISDLGQAKAGDVVLLHGCCQNPTGAQLSSDQWMQIAQLCTERGITPFIDLAYHGLGDGLDRDAVSTRLMLATLPDALVAYSCDKNFGLYRDRVGALWVQSDNADIAQAAQGNLLSITRSLWSMPPDHGAAVVRIILATQDLRANWLTELEAMRLRLNSLRTALAAAHPALTAIDTQRGMFALLPITAEAVIALRQDHGIYMASNGRINIAGLRIDTIPAFVAALAPYLPN
jgi:aromatic-amino-acid transaminase